MVIEFKINELDSFLTDIACQLGVEMKNGGFLIPSEQGKGHFKQVVFDKHFLLTYYELLLNEETTIIRKKGDNDNIIPLIFWLSNGNVRQDLDSERKIIGRDSPNGIFLPSNSLETSYTFPPGVLIKNITLFIDKRWLQNQIQEPNNKWCALLFSTKTFFLFEDMSLAMSEILIQMEVALKCREQRTLGNIDLYAHALRLMFLLLDKIRLRSINTKGERIIPQDIERLFQAKSILMREFASIPSASVLAKACGMNERKLQRIFRQVFGKTPYQFALEVRMKEAGKMLASKRYNVSEVGDLVGYTNLSHFISTFKAYYGVTPKAYLTTPV